MNEQARGRGEWLRSRLAFVAAILCAPLLAAALAIVIPFWFILCLVNALRAKPTEWWHDGVRIR